MEQQGGRTEKPSQEIPAGHRRFFQSLHLITLKLAQPRRCCFFRLSFDESTSGRETVQRFLQTEWPETLSRVLSHACSLASSSLQPQPSSIDGSKLRPLCVLVHPVRLVGSLERLS